MNTKIYKSRKLDNRMKKRLAAGFLFIFVSVLLLQFVSADGAYFPRPCYGCYVYPGQQRAVIFQEDNTETMILTSSFRGNAKDLVWIVPTPTKPEVTKANENVFNNAQKLIKTQRDYRYSYGDVMMTATSKSAESNVIVIQSKQVDYYDVNVLLATNSQDLVKWFNDNNYSYPESYAYVLKSYIDRGWYFTAIKISPEAQGATEVMQDLKEGNPTPIKMVFLSDKIVFPLKISSIDFKKTTTKKYGSARNEPIGATRTDSSGNVWTKVNGVGGQWTTTAPGYEYTIDSDYQVDSWPGGASYYDPIDSMYGSYTSISLYVFAKDKHDADGGFYTSYGNWVTKSDIVKLGNDDSGNPFISPKNNKYYFSYMTASLQKSQMDDDLILTKADDDKKVNAGPDSWQLFLYGLIIGFIVLMIWIFTPLGIMFIAGTLMVFFASSKGVRIAGWVLEIISLVITFAISLTFFIIAAANGAIGEYAVLSPLITALLIFIVSFVFIGLQIKYRKEK